VSSDLALAVRPHGTPSAIDPLRARGISFEPHRFRLRKYRAAQARAKGIESRPTGEEVADLQACQEQVGQQTSISWRIGMRMVRPGRTPGLIRPNRWSDVCAHPGPAPGNTSIRPTVCPSRPSHELLSLRAGGPIRGSPDTGRLQSFARTTSAAGTEADIGSKSPRKAAPPPGSEENVPIATDPRPDVDAAPGADKSSRSKRAPFLVSFPITRPRQARPPAGCDPGRTRRPPESPRNRSQRQAAD